MLCFSNIDEDLLHKVTLFDVAVLCLPCRQTGNIYPSLLGTSHMEGYASGLLWQPRVDTRDMIRHLTFPHTGK